MPASAQSAARHTRIVPGFHVVTALLTTVVLVLSLYRCATARSIDSLLLVLVGFALIGHHVYIRAFPLAVQDRLIRLEERLRLERHLPSELRPRIDEFTPNQLVALRFASDAELPAVVQRVLAERVESRKEIKAMIGTWRPDHMRV